MIDAALELNTLPGGGGSYITFTPQAEALKSNALALAGVIGKVTNAEENVQAVEAQKALHSLRSDVEKARQEAKKPALEFGRKVDEQARAFIAAVVDEDNRLGLLVGNYAALELAKQRAEERLRNEKYNDIEKRRAASQAQCKSHEELDSVNEAFDREGALLRVPLEGHRPAGQVFREDWEIEITNPWDLARMHPSCVKIMPRLEEIKSLLNAGFKVAGVKAEKKVKATVRSGKQPETITV